MQIRMDKYIDNYNQKIIYLSDKVSILEKKVDDITSENYILKNEIFMLKKKE